MGKRLALILVFILSFILFYNKAKAYLDPDFGWHLQMGNLILKNGVPKTDPFSYTMPSYAFIDHEWLTNVGFAIIFNKLGYSALAVFFSFIGTLTVFIASYGEIMFAALPFLLLSAIILPSFGIRPQAETWFLLSIFIQILFHENLWKRLRKFIPLLFILWVNLHGGFSIGIATLLAFIFVKTIEHKVDKTDFLIGLLSVLATFLNPYGPRIWYEIWMQATDNNLHSVIQEWTPGIMVLNLPFILFVALMLVFVLIFLKKIPKGQIVIFFCFLIAAISAERNVALWAIISSPILIGLFKLFKKLAKKESSFLVFYKITFFFVLSLFLYTFVSFEQTSLTNHSYYPTKAIDYLKKTNPNGNVFSSYNWGGFLIWKYSEKKVFVDGRMPSWRRSEAPPNESKNAFAEYTNIMLGKNSEQILKKYDVCTILLPKEAKLDKKALQKEKNLAAFLKNIGIKEDKPKGKIKTFQEMGFEVKYSDDTAVVYKKKNC